MAGHGGRRPGAGGPRKLSDWEADELRSLSRRGATPRQLASLYGVCERTVRRYLRKYDKECI